MRISLGMEPDRSIAAHRDFGSHELIAAFTVKVKSLGVSSALMTSQLLQGAERN